ncbi:hypothetical protein P3S67_032178 [Capsicum chacoense]
MSYCCIAGSSWLSHAQIHHKRRRSQLSALFKHLLCSRSLPTADGGTTRNVEDGSIQHWKSSAIGWKRMLFPVAKIKIRFLSSKAHILSEKWDHVPIVLAGDYTSTPHPIYKFLSSSEQLNLMLHNRKELSGQRRCHPFQVLRLRRERGTLFVLMDR